MSDMKFSCPQCGQHIGYNEGWAGHQIECPACHSTIIVPQVQRPTVVPSVSVPVSEPATLAGARLAPGVTQVARSTGHAPAPVKKVIPQHHGSDNSLLKYGVIVVVVAALAGAGYFYGLPLLNNALQQEPVAIPPAGAKAPQTGGNMGGPMGDVNGAMDVSETLDAGSSSAARSRPVPATNNPARSPSAKPPH